MTPSGNWHVAIIGPGLFKRKGNPMKKLFVCVFCFSLSALIAVGAAPKNAPIEGTWTATAAIIDGKKLTADEIAKAMLVVTLKAGKYTVTSGGKQLEVGTYKTDAKAVPATIDLTITEGKDKDKTQFGIFKVDGDQITFAIANLGIKDRPKDFDGSKDVEVTIMKRNK
jgi:uncharacterized protein (TIGR03067 family)